MELGRDSDTGGQVILFILSCLLLKLIPGLQFDLFVILVAFLFQAVTTFHYILSCILLCMFVCIRIYLYDPVLNQL